MASFNKAILLGNVTRDIEVKYTPGGTAVAEIGLAVNRSWFDKASNSKKEEVTFVDVTLWGRTAEIAEQYLSKGKPALVEGYLKLEQWDDKETGQKRSKMKVVCEKLQLLGNRNDGNRNEQRDDEPHASSSQPDPTFASDDDGSVPF